MKSLTKGRIRNEIWTRMEKEGVARFPRPVKGRIPNFNGAEAAAKKLTNIDVFKGAGSVKANPDSPQHPIRRRVIEEGKILYMPTPRLRSGFLRIDPTDVPQGEEAKAVTIKHSFSYGKKVDLNEIEKIDLVVMGSVAVTIDGRRIGKGGGYSDLEYAILRDLDLGEPPTVTTVHPLQLVKEIPVSSHDVPLDWIATPEKVIETSKMEKPEGIDWSLLSKEDLKKMFVLRRLKNLVDLDKAR